MSELSLKILRLSKPTFATAAPPSVIDISQPWSSQSSLVRTFDDFQLSNLLVLPSSFGNIYLGETFSSYVSVNNESNQVITSVSIKAELQTTSQRFTLADTILLEQKISLEPSQSAEFVLSHDIKELGIHILVCSVQYTYAGESKSFRKVY
jgi:hypothetical protein